MTRYKLVHRSLTGVKRTSSVMWFGALMAIMNLYSDELITIERE